jgi:hypothetical protein
MGPLSAKLRSVEGGVAHWCPACDESHVYRVPRWMFDGNVDSPTFSPSMLISWGTWGDDDPEDKEKYDGRICHYFLTAGKLAYCGDSTHALAGQTVDLPDWPKAYEERPGADDA